MTKVVIVGGGFGGLWAARELAQAPLRIVVVDRKNHHLFQPLLYQVATAALNPSDIAYPIRRILRDQKNADVILAEVTRVEPETRRLVLVDGTLSYDFLILAAGATHSYFGQDRWAPLAPGLKTVEDALEIRRRVLLAYEAAEREEHPEHRRAWLTFVVVGAGPTGVELAGALAEISRQTLVKDFRHIDSSRAQVVLLEAGDRILAPFSPSLSEKARRELERLGVEVRVGSKVTAIDAAGVSVGRERIPARVVLWAAGIAPSPLARSLGAPLDPAGRVLVTPELCVPGRPEIFIVGDLAAVPGVPGVAPAAIQMGRMAAQNVMRSMRSEQLHSFCYRDRGSLATIGRAAAVAQLGPVQLSGFVAWLAWALVHLYALIGFRNRLLVLLEWAWSFLTFDRGARLITGATGRVLDD